MTAACPGATPRPDRPRHLAAAPAPRGSGAAPVDLRRTRAPPVRAASYEPADPTIGRQPLPRRSPGRGYIGGPYDEIVNEARPALPRRVPGPGGHPGTPGPASGGRMSESEPPLPGPAADATPSGLTRRGPSGPGPAPTWSDPHDEFDGPPPPGAPGPAAAPRAPRSGSTYTGGPHARPVPDTRMPGPGPGPGPAPDPRTPAPGAAPPPLPSRRPASSLPEPPDELPGGQGEPDAAVSRGERRRRRRQDTDDEGGSGFWPERWRD